MSKKVLIVDDSSTALMMSQMILTKRTSYQIVTAANGEEAIAKAVQELPNLILMDVVMPKMNGFEACRELRKNESTAGIPVVMVTTRGEQDCVEIGFESGCNDYITKPVNAKELVTLVKSYLGEEN